MRTSPTTATRLFGALLPILAAATIAAGCSGNEAGGSTTPTTRPTTARIGGDPTGGTTPTNDAPIAVKVVTVVQFQDLTKIATVGSGEASWWYTSGGLTTKWADLGGPGAVFGNATGDHLLLVTGLGKSNAATSVTALATDPRFDLRRAYWIESGIGGGNPERTTIGGAVWEGWIVDGELSAQIDPRQLGDLRYYAMALGCTQPPFCAQAFPLDSAVFPLDAALQDAAVRVSGAVALADTPGAALMRAPYPQAAARATPTVQRGDVFGGDTFTHGSLLSGQMDWWVSGATKGAGRYAVTANEEPAVATALARAAASGRVDARRLAVVRSPSNFDQERPGQTALESLAVASSGGQPEGEALALQNTYLAANAVCRAILDDWARWSSGPPT